jgi:rubrerythrin
MHALRKMKSTNIDTEVRSDVIERLNALIQHDLVTSRSYELALEYVDEDAVREAFETFRGDHERHIVELTRVVKDLGGEVKEVTHDVKSVLLDSMTTLRSITGNLGALHAMRTNEKLSASAYAKTSRLDLPPRVLEVVTRELEDEQNHKAAIEHHIARLAENEKHIEIPQSHRY